MADLYPENKRSDPIGRFVYFGKAAYKSTHVGKPNFKLEL